MSVVFYYHDIVTSYDIKMRLQKITLEFDKNRQKRKCLQWQASALKINLNTL